MPSALEQQRAAAALLLDVISDAGFALAGFGAIREHGLSGRPTRDVDLFTNDVRTEPFAAAVERGVAALADHGHQVEIVRNAAQFARLAVAASDGYQFEVDLGVDWRAHQPVRLQVGPVLALPDAVANKVGALYNRAAARDYLDVDTIRQSGRFTDDDLLRLAVEHDPGFDPVLFAEQLGQVITVRASALTEYGVSPERVRALQHRLTTWRRQLLERHATKPIDTAPGQEVTDPLRSAPHRRPPTRPDRPPPRFTV